MLSEYQIHNFKAFANQEKIPIRPITLIYGQNSSGKSSVLQSLLLLKQTLQEATDPQTLLLAKGNFVDLGNFSQFINQHDLDKSFSFTVFFDINDQSIKADSNFLSDYLKSNPILGLRISFKYDAEISNIGINNVDLFVGSKQKPVISYSCIRNGRSDSISLIADEELSTYFDHSFWQAWWGKFRNDFFKKLFSEIKSILEYHDKSDHDDNKISSRPTKKTIVKKLKERINLIHSEIEEIEEGDAPQLSQSKVDSLDHWLAEMNFLSQLYERLDKYSFEQAKEDLLLVTGYYETILCRNFLPDETFKYDFDSDEIQKHYLSLIYSETGALKPIFDLTLMAASLLKSYLNDLIYIRPLRAYPERLYVFSENPSEQVGQTGKMIANTLYKSPEVLDAVNKQLELFDLGYEIKISNFKDEDTSDLSDVFAIRLIDKYTKVNVSLLDVGFGISQILPVIIQSVLSRNKTIIIEQPEIHIHPRLQAQLGSLLAESVKSFGNRFIIETHSEHLLLRLQKLIRKGELSHEDIAVVYIDRGENGSQCLELRLDSEGDFIDEWPNGFFDEGFNEMFG
jgi:AAA15 family ATPase/GTPase